MHWPRSHGMNGAYHSLLGKGLSGSKEWICYRWQRWFSFRKRGWGRLTERCINDMEDDYNGGGIGRYYYRRERNGRKL